MTSSVNLPLSASNWENLPLTQAPTPQQLQQIQTHLQLVWLSLESLVTIEEEMMLQAALDLEINTTITEKLKSWSKQETVESLTIEQMRSLILIVCYVAQQHQELIRRAVTLLEQMTAQEKDPRQITLLSRYFQRFNQHQTLANQASETEQHTKLACKLLIDLLFYSAESGHDRLWLTLLDYTH